MTNKNIAKLENDETNIIANTMTTICVSFSTIIIALSIFSYLIRETDAFLIGISSFILSLLISLDYYVYTKRH
jgi:hypothetical protein